MLLIIIPEVTSIKDAYGLLKILKSKNIIRPVKVVVNKAQNKSQVENIFNKFKEAVNNFYRLTYLSLDLYQMKLRSEML